MATVILYIDFYIRADKPEKVTWNLDLFNFVKVYVHVLYRKKCKYLM